ncbi:MAG: ATP-binding protein [Chitinophagales bacterium]|nr:ATP-binding protein [Chitinophagales bacterium]
MVDSNDILRFKSLPENLTLVEDYIEKVCNECNVGPDVFGNILVSVTEAVNNAIYHGNDSDESKEVQLSYHFNKELHKISFIVKDQGNGFDYNNLPDPTAPENLSMIGGRGVFLIKQLADWVIFSDNGSVLEIQFKV